MENIKGISLDHSANTGGQVEEKEKGTKALSQLLEQINAVDNNEALGEQITNFWKLTNNLSNNFEAEEVKNVERRISERVIELAENIYDLAFGIKNWTYTEATRQIYDSGNIELHDKFLKKVNVLLERDWKKVSDTYHAYEFITSDPVSVLRSLEPSITEKCLEECVKHIHKIGLSNAYIHMFDRLLMLDKDWLAYSILKKYLEKHEPSSDDKRVLKKISNNYMPNTYEYKFYQKVRSGYRDARGQELNLNE